MPNLVLTTACNRRCRYCFAAAGAASREDASRLSLADLDWALAFLARSGLRQVGLLGGEPTLHPDFYEIVARVCASGFRARLFTNGLLPEATVAFLNSLRSEDLTTTVNVNGPADVSGGEHEAVRTLIGRLGAKIQLGYTVYDPETDLEFLFDLIEASNGASRIRLGLAHPALGSGNTHLPLASLRQCGSRLVGFIRQARDRGITVVFDCGFSRCMFTETDLVELESCGAGIRFYCAPVIDIGPGLDVWRCFPLQAWGRRNLRDFADYRSVVLHFAAAGGTLGRVGVLPECPRCQHLHRGDCAGGCLAHTLRASAYLPPLPAGARRRVVVEPAPAGDPERTEGGRWPTSS